MVGKNWKTATIVLASIASLFLLIIVTIVAVVIADGVGVKTAFHYAATNASICSVIPCTVLPDDRLGVPAAPTAGTYSPTYARFCADLVLRLADYVNGKTPVLSSPPRMTTVGTISTPQGKNAAWVVRTDDSSAMWLVFRGTATRAEWEADFKMQQAPFTIRLANRKTSELAFPEMAGNEMRTGIFGEHVFVHTGFLSLYESTRYRILALVGSLPASTQFHIAGHSLGGAQALLCALDLCKTFPTRTFDAYVFGAPRVGNPVFANALNTAPNLSSLFMLVNTADMVPDVPLAVQPNVLHPEKPWKYTHSRTILFFTENWGSWLANHTLPIYIKHLHDVGETTSGGYAAERTRA